MNPNGSSPLARGLPKRKSGLYAAGRIIPARAGFTPTGRASPPSSADHPRSRGVYPSSRPTRTPRRGSSPLARGLQIIGLPEPEEGGIIPARAGFTPRRIESLPREEDHPRSRGVYYHARPCLRGLQ